MMKIFFFSAVEKVRKSGVKIQEVYSPFPVHGLDEALGYKRSRLTGCSIYVWLTGNHPGPNHADLYAGHRLANDYWW